MTYNKFHIAVGTTGYNFAWFHPRRSASHCHIHLRVANESREATVQKLQEAGVNASPRRRNSIKLVITAREVDERETLLREVLLQAEQRSRTRGSRDSEEE